MRLLVLILFSTTSFPSPSTSTSTSSETSDPSLFETTEDQLSIPSEDIFDTQIYPVADNWNLPQDSPNLDLSFLDASCSNQADEANLPLIAKLRSRAQKPGGACTPEGTANPGGSEPVGQNDLDEINAPVVNTDPEFPIPVFPDVLQTGLSPNICEKLNLFIMFPVCDSGNPMDRSISLIYQNPLYLMYKLDNCFICTFLRLFLFSFPFIDPPLSPYIYLPTCPPTRLILILTLDHIPNSVRKLFQLKKKTPTSIFSPTRHPCPVLPTYRSILLFHGFENALFRRWLPQSQ